MKKYILIHISDLYILFLLFFKKNNNIIEFLLDNEKINSIFSIECNILNPHKFFFNTFYSDYNIKIIISNTDNANSFFKIISYISQAKCIYVSVKNINNLKSIEDIFNTLIESENKYYLFFTHITSTSLYFQKHIIELYLSNIINKNDILIKIFFILNEEKNLSLIDNEIISMSKIIILSIIPINQINEEYFCIILKNYTDYIIKKNYSIDIIKEIYKFYYEKINTNLYIFFDFFEKIIDSFSLDKIQIDNTDNFYINNAIKLKKNALKNIFLMEKIGYLHNYNCEKIAKLLNLNKSTISKYYRNYLSN